MGEMKRTALVTGATGKQGGAAARALLARGYAVRALTRQPEGAAATALRAAGAEIVTGSFDDTASLGRALAGVDACFAVSTPFEAGMEAETQQGLRLVEAAAAAGVRHLVYTSVASADRQTGIPHFESKVPVEERIRTLGVPFTILAPVYFMENLLAPWNLQALKGGVYAQALPAGRRLQQVTVADVGAFAAHVIDAGTAYLGQRIDLASDEVSGEQVVETLSRLTGRAIAYREIPIDAMRAQNADFGAMYDWFNRVGYSADIAGLRQRAPEVGWHTFESWAGALDWPTLLA